MTIKDVKRSFIIDSAVKLFTENSVAEVTMKDVAAKTGFGEATLYRHFSNRKTLVIACALKLEEEVYSRYFTLGEAGKGFDRLAAFYGAYLKIFDEHPEFYRFLSEFDAFCINENVGGLDEYSRNLDSFRSEFYAAYECGVKDGSVKPLGDVRLFYYSTTHAMLALCNKLASGVDIVKQDRLVNRENEIREVIGAFLGAIKA